MSSTTNTDATGEELATALLTALIVNVLADYGVSAEGAEEETK